MADRLDVAGFDSKSKKKTPPLREIIRFWRTHCFQGQVRIRYRKKKNVARYSEQSRVVGISCVGIIPCMEVIEEFFTSHSSLSAHPTIANISGSGMNSLGLVHGWPRGFGLSIIDKPFLQLRKSIRRLHPDRPMIWRLCGGTTANIGIGSCREIDLLSPSTNKTSDCFQRFKI